MFLILTKKISLNRVEWRKRIHSANTKSLNKSFVNLVVTLTEKGHNGKLELAGFMGLEEEAA